MFNNSETNNKPYLKSSSAQYSQLKVFNNENLNIDINNFHKIFSNSSFSNKMNTPLCKSHMIGRDKERTSPVKLSHKNDLTATTRDISNISKTVHKLNFTFEDGRQNTSNLNSVSSVILKPFLNCKLDNKTNNINNQNENDNSNLIGTKENYTRIINNIINNAEMEKEKEDKPEYLIDFNFKKESKSKKPSLTKSESRMVMASISKFSKSKIKVSGNNSVSSQTSNSLSNQNLIIGNISNYSNSSYSNSNINSNFSSKGSNFSNINNSNPFNNSLSNISSNLNDARIFSPDLTLNSFTSFNLNSISGLSANSPNFSNNSFNSFNTTNCVSHSATMRYSSVNSRSNSHLNNANLNIEEYLNDQIVECENETEDSLSFKEDGSAVKEQSVVKMLIPKEKINDEAFKLLKINKYVRKPEIPSNKSVRTADYYKRFDDGEIDDGK